jgi:uncharacterized protein
MSQTLSLYRLQQVDIQMDRARSRLKTIQESLDDDAEFRLANERVELMKELFQSADKALKSSEANAQDQRIKIEQIEASLYKGKGHSTKELLDLQNDVAALKRHLVALEDIQLEAMQTLEEALTADQAAQAQLQVVMGKLEEQNRGLHAEQASIQKDLEKLAAERSAVADPIPADALRLYDQLRQQRRGIAVAIINDKSCSACGSGLSAAQMQSSRASGSIALCPSCGRILYGS